MRENGGAMLKIEESADGATLTIIPVGRFDARMHRTFLEAYTTRPVPSSHYVVDFAQTEYIDSTGLGMLLKLREFAGGGKARVHLLKCSPQIKSILSIANFHSLVTIP